MLIARLGSTCAVLGRETDRRKASVGMCIVRWRVTNAVVMAARRPRAERIGGPERHSAPPPSAGLAPCRHLMKP